ncbi:hypothetical protein [Sagittula sp. S175]|uniref:hypothetical protein n=1 Tax=Sagittula sp. S175 TaxID=3415129 RepID=UPI003C7DD956
MASESESEPLIALLRDVDGTVEAIGFEAGLLSQWLHRAMTVADFPTVRRHGKLTPCLHEELNRAAFTGEFVVQ